MTGIDLDALTREARKDAGQAMEQVRREEWFRGADLAHHVFALADALDAAGERERGLREALEREGALAHGRHGGTYVVAVTGMTDGWVTTTSDYERIAFADCNDQACKRIRRALDGVAAEGTAG